MLTSLNTKAEKQANSTHDTEAEITHFLYYASTNPNTIVQYKAIGITLHIDIDAL